MKMALLVLLLASSVALAERATVVYRVSDGKVLNVLPEKAQLRGITKDGSIAVIVADVDEKIKYVTEQTVPAAQRERKKPQAKRLQDATQAEVQALKDAKTAAEVRDAILAILYEELPDK